MPLGRKGFRGSAGLDSIEVESDITKFPSEWDDREDGVNISHAVAFIYSQKYRDLRNPQ